MSSFSGMSTPQSSQTRPEIPKTVIGALFLLLRELLPSLPTSVASMVEILGVGKSQCYELKERLREVLPDLLHSPGRPTTAIEQGVESTVFEACYDYVAAHPGSVCTHCGRRRYSSGFRCFVVDLVAPGGPAEGMSLENIARLTRVPLGTLKDWLFPPAAKAEEARRSETSTGEPCAQLGEPEGSTVEISAFDSIQDARIKTLISQWPTWQGSFQSFCQAMKLEFAIPFSSTTIGNHLQAMGLRYRKPRASKEEPGSRDTFRLHFPGAQWLGDGTALAIYWNGQKHVFNIEALLDTASNAVTGFAVTDVEDAEALRLAYEASLETTQGVVPWAVTLDNKPCNTCDAAVAALDDATVLYGFPGRGQSKAALEGAFGLFAQAMPALDIRGDSDREMARSTLRTVLTAWHRGRHGRPRRRFRGRTPAQVFFEDHPTPEQLAEWTKWLMELLRRQDAARLTREARLDPVRIELLKAGLAELGIADPDDRLAKSMACFSRDSIVRGLAIFGARRNQGTLPQESHNDGVYLRGIISNQHTRMELEQIEVHLMKQRLRARDLNLEPLMRATDKLRAQVSKEQLAQGKLVKDFLSQALSAPYRIDFLYWAKATTNAFLSLPAITREALYKTLVRRVAGAFKVDPERRTDLMDRLVACLVHSTVSAA